ncbi:Glutamate receptor-like 11 [Homarus americanus]|uniref:Glutamate receptor-like 11 n=2 Tax=Homarus americanus TaxID=6706 RepID=A0A8J5MQD1_HOMAM|nr:Glutamate receptor-like 11 [Homarus americanus]
MRVASWTPQRGLSLKTHLPLFPDKFFKFISQPRLVVTMEEAMTTKAVTKADPEAPGGQRLWFTGSVPNVMEAIAESINFSYTYVRSPDRTWGTKLPNGSWSGMMGVVTRGEADIGLGYFIMTVSRAEDVDFTWPMIVSYSGIVAPRGGAEVDPWGFLLPLQPLVWTAILTALLVLSSGISLLDVCHSRKFVNGGSRTMDAYDLLRVLLQQDISKLSNRWWWERLVLAVWMLMTLVLTRSYAGNLMALLAVRHISEPYKTLREVLDDPSVTMIWQENSANVQYFRSADQGMFREVREAETAGRVKFLQPSDYNKKVPVLLRRGDHVLIDAEILLKPFKAEAFSSTGRCDFHTSREHYLTIIAGLITQMNSPLLPALHNRILRILESGLYDQWTKEITPNSTSCAHPPTKITVNTSLSITNIWGMFVALGTGLALGLLMFVLEFLTSCPPRL